MPRRVRPHARAGVEIAALASSPRAARFALMRGRELKCRAGGFFVAGAAFALMRGRELKYIARLRAIQRGGSPSCEGGS